MHETWLCIAELEKLVIFCLLYADTFSGVAYDEEYKTETMDDYDIANNVGKH
jgi:hypothetical protein